MFTVMQFLPTGFNSNFVVRTVRIRPFKSLEAAKNALLKTGNEGYIQQAGVKAPVFHNVRH